ncbi:MAG: hypothetical protein WBF33_22040 [Candidatus Nitrosopolaris sp.]
MSCTIIITSEYKSSMTEQQKKEGVFVTLDVCALLCLSEAAAAEATEAATEATGDRYA